MNGRTQGASIHGVNEGSLEVYKVASRDVAGIREDAEVRWG